MTDTDYWASLNWPAAPNLDDYKIFESYITGRVLLLGSTKLLLPLATEAWDLAPVYDDPKILVRDWFTLDEHWDTIIIDGGLSYGQEFTKRLLPIVLAHCNCFVSRTFLNPNWPTKYAVYFPKANELLPVPEEHAVNKIYTFYIWNKK
ncbi:hypothetical protein UFOVP1636_301 [uncultured Caudovirales phage]|uniref:Uncharacterized protein n=1 Tax=uncultured Caudovirales phage TaxID=2100421 RepID=A0A6J5T1K0_9CAUD|nr:hypothetical protein UFOVP1636_301 [uncultured Caudovirales phage]